MTSSIISLFVMSKSSDATCVATRCASNSRFVMHPIVPFVERMKFVSGNGNGYSGCIGGYLDLGAYEYELCSKKMVAVDDIETTK